MRAKGEGGEGEERGLDTVRNVLPFLHLSFLDNMGCRSTHYSMYVYALVSTRMCVLGRMVSPNDDKDA